MMSRVWPCRHRATRSDAKAILSKFPLLAPWFATDWLSPLWYERPWTRRWRDLEMQSWPDQRMPEKNIDSELRVRHDWVRRTQIHEHLQRVGLIVPILRSLGSLGGRVHAFRYPLIQSSLYA
jgi:hypothetical protein